MPRFQHKTEYPVSHLSAIVQYAADQRALKPFTAYVWQEGMSTEGIQGGPLTPGDYVIVGDDGAEWASDKAFFDSQYQPVTPS